MPVLVSGIKCRKNLTSEVMGYKYVGGLDIPMNYRSRTSIVEILQCFAYAYCYLVVHSPS
jgi:hypothetical protein